MERREITKNNMYNVKVFILNPSEWIWRGIIVDAEVKPGNKLLKYRTLVPFEEANITEKEATDLYCDPSEKARVKLFLTIDTIYANLCTEHFPEIPADYEEVGDAPKDDGDFKKIIEDFNKMPKMAEFPDIVLMEKETEAYKITARLPGGPKDYIYRFNDYVNIWYEVILKEKQLTYEFRQTVKFDALGLTQTQMAEQHAEGTYLYDSLREFTSIHIDEEINRLFS